MAQRYDYTVLIGGVDATAVFNKMGGPAVAQEYLADEWVLVKAPPKPAPSPPEPKVYLKRLFEGETIPVSATKEGVVAEERAKRVFAGYVDPRLLAWKSKKAAATDAMVDKLVEKGKFPDFLGKTAAALEVLRWQWAQAVEFVELHPSKLQKNGAANFFVLTKDGEEVQKDLSNVFVLSVSADDRGQWYADLNPFSDDGAWSADYGHRVVSPQQVPLAPAA